MEHELTVRLSDDKYTELTSDAIQKGQRIEDLIQKLLDEVLERKAQQKKNGSRSSSMQEVLERLV